MSGPRLKIRCPNCQKDGSVRAELLNRRVACKHCQHVFRAVAVDDTAAPTKVLPTPPDSPPVEPRRPSKGRIEALEGEVRRLRDDPSAGRAEAQPLRDQLDQTQAESIGDPRDRLRQEELKFLRDQLDKARAEVESEARKRREAAASLAAGASEHAKALEAQAAEHAEALASKEAERAEGLRQALDRPRAEAEARHVEARALRDELARTKAGLDEATRALDGLRLDRDRLDADHARTLGELRGQLAGLEARLGDADADADADAIRADRDRLAGELEAHRVRLLEADRSALGHQAVVDALRLDRDRLEAARSAESAGLREELEAARAARPDVEAALAERDEALALRDRLIEELEALRSRVEGAELSGDWSYPSTELEVRSANADAPTEAEVPALAAEGAAVEAEPSTVFDGNPDFFLFVPGEASGVLSFEGPEGAPRRGHAEAPAVEDDRLADRERLEAEAGSLRADLERARAEAEAASRRNRELADRIHALEREKPSGSSPAPASIEAERDRAVEEAVKRAWADFERRLSETQARLKAANDRADLMEAEARRTLERAADLGRGRGPGARPVAPEEAARLSLADAEARLGLARQVAVDRKDKALIDRIARTAEKVEADLDARNDALAEVMVRGIELEAGLDPGGFSIAGLRIFRPIPAVVEGLAAHAPALERAMRQGDLASIRAAVDQMKAILGDQAGLPETRRVGRTPASRRPIAGADALGLFVAALEAEGWLMRPIAARKPLPDTSLTTYAGLVEACSAARQAAEEHAPDRLPLLDSVIQAACPMLVRRQQPDGHFAFLDPRGKASKLASVVEGMVARRPESVKDGWVVLVDPIGMAQAETAACAIALSTAGKALGRPEWSRAALKAADWAMGQPSLPNFVANAASAGLLARAYLDAGQTGHLDGLASRLTLGVLPGQVEDGRWVDAPSATTPNHLIILRALHDAWEAIPPDREALRRALKPATDRAMSSLLDESRALGVPPQGHGLRDLIRHRDLTGLDVDPRLEPAILDAAAVVQELCHDGPRPKLGVAPNQLAALIRAS